MTVDGSGQIKLPLNQHRLTIPCDKTGIGTARVTLPAEIHDSAKTVSMDRAAASKSAREAARLLASASNLLCSAAVVDTDAQGGGLP